MEETKQDYIQTTRKRETLGSFPSLIGTSHLLLINPLILRFTLKYTEYFDCEYSRSCIRTYLPKKLFINTIIWFSSIKHEHMAQELFDIMIMFSGLVLSYLASCSAIQYPLYSIFQ